MESELPAGSLLFFLTSLSSVRNSADFRRVLRQTIDSLVPMSSLMLWYQTHPQDSFGFGEFITTQINDRTGGDATDEGGYGADQDSGIPTSKAPMCHGRTDNCGGEADILAILAPNVAIMYHYIEKIDRIEDLLSKQIDPACFGNRLTPREAVIASMILLKFTAVEIGARFNISRRTVDKHTANAYEKLGVRCREELQLLYRNHRAAERLANSVESGDLPRCP